jgi:uncharacterized protein, YigZ family
MVEYKTILNYIEWDMFEKKSHFICSASPVGSEQEALNFIKKVSLKYKDATHNVFAYIVNEDVEIQKASDDGEPQGTAGIPILEILKREELKNVCVVVTRYFGGILLGAGGLIRAYSASARGGIDKAKIVKMCRHKKIKVITNYSNLGRIQNLMNTMGNNIIDIKYTEFVTLIIGVRYDLANKCLKAISEITRCEGDMDFIEDYFQPLEVK